MNCFTPLRSEDPSQALLRIHVVGGPDSGKTSALPRNGLVVGRDPDCDLQILDPRVSRRHVVCEASESAVTVTDLGSTNGSELDGNRLEPGATHRWPVGGLLRIGSSALTVLDSADQPAAVRVDGTTRLISRPPRAQVVPQPAVAVPQATVSADAPRLQLMAVGVALIATGGLALVMHNAQLLLFGLLSPVMLVGGAVSDRFSYRRTARRRRADSMAAYERIQQQITDLAVVEVAHRRSSHPDPAALGRIAVLAERRIWERRRDDPDFLDVRVGLGNAPSRLQTVGASAESARTLSDVPHYISLPAAPVGLVGPRLIASGLARWLVAQIVALHSPADVGVLLLLCAKTKPDWLWARWLPHLDGVSVDDSACRTTMASLQRLVVARSKGPANGWTGRWTVVVIDRSDGLSDLPGLADVLDLGPRVGVSVLCLDEDGVRLPMSCTTVIQARGETGLTLRISDSNDVATREASADLVGLDWAESVARSLAPLADASAAGPGGIPTSCGLLEVIGVDAHDDAEVCRRWSSPAHLATAIGLGSDGIVTIDLQQDGPHALVAGTTGAGKSEFLRTLVAGLAVNNSPADLAFILIDYKGGAAFAECGRLPHTVGLVTDLDPQLTERALQSLDTELRRREAILAGAQVSDLDAYQNSDPESEPLGRLVLVVDEFAALAADLPDFVSGLVGIAQRGRSLGVHLVLATQRPGGAVSPEIRANTSLRVSLRVNSVAESADIVGVDSAAHIDKATPGRAIVRVASAVAEVQCAHVGALIRPDPEEIEVHPLDEWARPVCEAPDNSAGPTELGVLVETLARTATLTGTPRVRCPWLPPLPACLPLAELPRPDDPNQGPDASIGLQDDPAEQRQLPLSIDLATGGTTLVIGAPRSGRTTALRTMAAAGVTRWNAQQLHLYILDGGGGGLTDLGRLPHCGSVVTRSDPATMARVLERLSDEIGRRHQILASSGASFSNDADRLGMSRVLVLIDGWEGFVAALDEYDVGRSVDTLFGIVRDCSAVGVSVVVSGGRGTLMSRLAGLAADRFVLRLADVTDYALAGIAARSAPVDPPPGRAVHLPSAKQVQFAVCGSDGTSAAQRRGLEQLVAGNHPAAGRSGGPMRITQLPHRLELAELIQPTATPVVFIGVGGDGAEPVSLNLRRGARWLLAGPSRSGRSNLLAVVLAQCHRLGMRPTVLAAHRSPIRALASALGLEVMGPDSSAQTVQEAFATSDALLADDIESYADTELEAALSTLMRADHGPATIIAGRSDEIAISNRRLASHARQTGTGILLQPTAIDGDLLGVTLPRARQPPIPGRGLLIDDHRPGGRPIPLQIALAP